MEWPQSLRPKRREAVVAVRRVLRDLGRVGDDALTCSTIGFTDSETNDKALVRSLIAESGGDSEGSRDGPIMLARRFVMLKRKLSKDGESVGGWRSDCKTPFLLNSPSMSFLIRTYSVVRIIKAFCYKYDARPVLYPRMGTKSK